jgi:hypothetical protein
VRLKIESYLQTPSPFLQRLLGRKIEPDSVDESSLPEGILTVLADRPQQALAAALRCRPLVYDQIAVLMGVSRDRVRQLELRAANALRRASRFRQLCRFIPGWQNALRLRPEDKMSLLPGETLPFSFGRKRKSHPPHHLPGSNSNGSHQKLARPKKKKSKPSSPQFKRRRPLPSAKP